MRTRRSSKEYKELGIDISRTTLNHSAKQPPGTLPQRVGRTAILPAWFDEEVFRWICALRSFHVDVDKELVMAFASGVLQGTAEAEKLKHGCDENWFRRFMRKNREKLGLATTRNLEVDRAEWRSAENARIHYVRAAEVLVGCGLAKWNPDFDFTREGSEPIFITHPDGIISSDETDGSLDQSKDRSKGVFVRSGSKRKMHNRDSRTNKTHSICRLLMLGLLSYACCCSHDILICAVFFHDSVSHSRVNYGFLGTYSGSRCSLTLFS